MTKLSKMFDLLSSLILDAVFIIVWLGISWFIHDYLVTRFSLSGIQLYKFSAIEISMDLSIFYKLYKHLFIKEKTKPSVPWWY